MQDQNHMYVCTNVHMYVCIPPQTIVGEAYIQLEHKYNHMYIHMFMLIWMYVRLCLHKLLSALY